MIEDILQYLHDDESDEYDTFQSFLGIKYLFHQFVSKIWVNIDFSSDKYYQIHKILIKYCVMYY